MASPLEDYEWEARQQLIKKAQAEQARQLELIRKNNPQRYEQITGKPAQFGMGPRDTGNPWVDDWGVGVSRKRLQDIIDNRLFDDWRIQIPKDNRRNFEEFQGVNPFGKRPQNNGLTGVTGTSDIRTFKPQYGPVEWPKPGESFTTGTGMRGTPKTYQDVPYAPAKPGYTWGSGMGGTAPQQQQPQNQSLTRRIGDIDRNTARDYGPQTAERFHGWESRVDIAGRRDRDAASRRDIPATRDLGWMDPRRLNFEPGSLSGRAKPQELNTYGFEGGKIGPNQSLVELQRQERQRELTRVNNQNQSNMEKFQQSRVKEGGSAGSNWTSGPIKSDAQRIRDEANRLRGELRPREEQAARQRINDERERFKPSDYDVFSDRARRLAEKERMPGTPEQISGTKPIGGRTTAQGNIKPFNSSSSGSRQVGTTPLSPYEDGYGSNGSGRWNKPKPDNPSGGGGGGIDWESIRRKANPKTIIGMMGDKGNPTQNRGPVGTIERPSSPNVLGPKRGSDPTVTRPFSGNASRGFVRGVGGVGAAADLIGQGLAWKNAIDRQRDIEALRRQLKNELGFSDKQLDDIQKNYRPKYRDREFIQNDSELDMFAPGGLRDAARAAKRGMSPERFKRERFGPQTKEDFKKDLEDRRKEPYKPIDWEGNKRKFDKDMDDMLGGDKSPPWKPGEKERNRKKWDNFDPLDSRWSEPRRQYFEDGTVVPPGWRPGPEPESPLPDGMYYVLYAVRVGFTQGGIVREEVIFTESWLPWPVYAFINQEGEYAGESVKIGWRGEGNPSSTQWGPLSDYGPGGEWLDPPVGVVPRIISQWIHQIDFEPETRPEPDLYQAKPDEEEPMPCRYAEDLEAPTQLDYFDKVTKKMDKRSFSIHKGTDEAFKFLAAQVAGLSQSISNLSDVLDVDAYKQPAGKIVTPVITAQVYQTAMAAQPVTAAAAIPMVRTLQGEMGIWAAMNHMFSGHHMLGKTSFPADVTKPSGELFTPKNLIKPGNMMSHAHWQFNQILNVIGIPSNQAVLNAEGLKTSSSFRNQADAVEQINAQAVEIKQDLSGIEEYLLKIAQQNEQNTQMIFQLTKDVECLMKDAGFRTKQVPMRRPSVFSHGKATQPGTENAFNWAKTFGLSNPWSVVRVWDDKIDARQLANKTHMEAQKSAISTFYPISKSGTYIPTLRTKAQKSAEEDNWRKWVKTTEAPGPIRQDGFTPVPDIDVIQGGVSKEVPVADVQGLVGD